MTPTPEQRFTLHDVSQFPFVCFDAASAHPGYAAQWAAELEALFERGAPFVIIAEGTVEDTPADRVARSRFLKSHREPLRRLCRAIIGIEPDGARRLARNAQALLLGKAFGLEMRFVATLEEALRIARERLGEGGADD